jgi:uncharacterized protein YndB with AHSA1/START domain
MVIHELYGLYIITIRKIGKMKNVLITETSLSVNAAPAGVWKVLTTPRLIRKYLMGTDVTSDWKDESAIDYTGVYEGKAYHDRGIIKKLEAEKLFQRTYLSSMSGKEDKPENYNLVTYILLLQGDRTIITPTQDNVSTEKEHSTKNWKTVLEKIKEIVESGGN